MIKFKGRSHLKQYLPKKPCKWGYKIIARCGVSGIINNFHIQGEIFTVPPNSIGYSGDVVLFLCQNLPREQSFLLFCDRWYTSLPLLKMLKERQIFATGTIMQNRLRKCPVKADKEMRDRGAIDFLVDIKSDIRIVKWMDNRSVLLASTYFNQEPVGNCLR
jgi:hypothetical protein